MLSHAVESIEIAIPARELCSFLAERQNLPKWTNAFMRVGDKSATMKTEGGSVRVGLEVVAAAESGSVDWIMTFPDGARATAFSRVVPTASDRSIYVFVLTPPPVPLERIEGTLGQQRITLREELFRLRAILEDPATHERQSV